MLLSEVVVVLMGLALLTFVPLRLAAELRVKPAYRGPWVADHVALAMICAMVVAMAFRSLAFGVDTAAYAELFADFCAGHEIDKDEASFTLSAWLLNGVMLGACSNLLFPAAWVGLVVAELAICARHRVPRGTYTAVLLMSMIGIELTTNALRQGVAVGLLVAAVSHWERRRWLSVALFAFALSMHGSVALAIAAIALSTLSWRSFLPAMAGLALAAVSALEAQIDLALIQPFLYEIRKYLAHENDEIWIRALAFASVLIALATPLVCARRGPERGIVVKHPHYHAALKLLATCIPFLLLPYFGYRYIYAIYPVVLWLSLSAVGASRQRRGWHFALTLALNLTVLLGWSYGSSYMRDVPFFD